MSIFKPQTASAWGAIDDDAIEATGPYSAHILGTLAEGVNRLTSKSRNVAVFPFFTAENPPSEVPAVARGYSVPYWALVLDAYVIKPPDRRLLDFRFWMVLPAGERVRVQIETNAVPFNEAADPNTQPNVGDFLADVGGAAKKHELNSVVFGDQMLEPLRVFILGSSPTTARNTDVGQPTTGTVGGWHGEDTFYTNAAPHVSNPWDLSQDGGPTFATERNLCAFEDSGILLYQPFLIDYVGYNGSLDREFLRLLDPGNTLEDQVIRENLTGTDFTILAPVQWELFSISCWTTGIDYGA